MSGGTTAIGGSMTAAWARAWVPAIVALSIGAVLSVALDLPAPWRPLLTLAFIVICPGMALVRLIGIDGVLTEAMLAIALSLSLAGIVAGVFLYVGAWSPTAAFLALVAVAWGALAIDPTLAPRRRWIPGIAALLASARRSTDDAGKAPPGPAGGPRDAELPPPPVAVVRRRAPARTTPRRTGSGRAVLGMDPFEEEGSGRALRTTIEQVVDDLADQRDGRGS